MAISSHGTLLQIADTAALGGYATVAEVMDMTLPAIARGVEAIYADDGYAAVIVGDRELTELTFDINYTGAATQVALREAARARDLVELQVVFPTTPNEVAAFSGYVTRFEVSAPVEGILRASVTISFAADVVFS